LSNNWIIEQRDFKMKFVSQKLLLLALSACILLLHASLSQAKERPLNIVLVLVDDLGWTDLSCQGSKYFETPNVDRLAAEGIRFTNGYAACAVCSPTRASVMTGRYPARVGVTDWIRARFQGGTVPPAGTVVDEYVGGKNRALLCPRNPLYMEHSETTLAEILGEAGYVSCHIGKWHLGPDDWYPQKQGFTYNFGGCDLGQPHSYFDPYTTNRRPEGIPTLQARQPGEYLTDREGDEAVNFIRKHKDDPFFLYLANYAVHTPLGAKKELIEKYQAKPATNQKNATYAGMVESVDDAVGNVMKVLDELKLADNTLIIFSSDNGGLLGPTHNAPLRSGKGFPYEGGIRVPYIVRWPGVVKPKQINDTPVCSIDFLPTILDACGVEKSKDTEIDGVSLLPLLQSEGRLGDRPLFWHFPHYRFARGPYSIVRDGDWKMIYWFEEDGVELFNLTDDLSETTDLAAKEPARVAALKKQLEQWYVTSGAKLPKKNPLYVGKK
jgi:arylsulfatase A